MLRLSQLRSVETRVARSSPWRSTRFLFRGNERKALVRLASRGRFYFPTWTRASTRCALTIGSWIDLSPYPSIAKNLRDPGIGSVRPVGVPISCFSSHILSYHVRLYVSYRLNRQSNSIFVLLDNLSRRGLLFAVNRNKFFCQITS